MILNPPGQDNLLTIGVSQTQGVQDDALRLELTNTGADPAVTGWHDYTYVYNGVARLNDDTQSNP